MTTAPGPKLVGMSLLHEAPHRPAAAEAAARGFSESFGYEPDGVFSAPGRVNIIGEHVDYQAGLCLPMAISHRCFVAAARTDSDTLRIRSAQVNEVFEGTARGLTPGSANGWVAYVAGVMWALGSFFKADAVRGMDIFVDGHVPLGAGLSSSASLECAAAEAIESLFSLGTSEHERIRASITAETEFAGAATGGLDQSASILCREGGALLLDCIDFSTELVPWDLAGQGLALLIIDTRASHSLVGGEYGERRAQAEEAARLLGVETLRHLPFDQADRVHDIDDPTVRARARHVVSEIERVRRFAALLESGSIRDNTLGLGLLMNASHDSLRDDFEVTVPELDVAVDAARAAGAHGARMTGGGFGGSAIALVEETDVEQVAQAVHDAFRSNSFTEPAFFIATPSAGAGRDL